MCGYKSLGRGFPQKSVSSFSQGQGKRLQNPHIFTELSTFFLKAQGDYLVSCLSGDVFKVEGNLEMVFTDPVGSDYIGQADNGCFFIRQGHDQLDAIVAGGFYGKQGQNAAPAEVDGRADHSPRLHLELFGAGDITGLNRNIDGNPEIIA